jgi:hypothetical protein
MRNETILNGILALMVAEREERGRPSARILTRAGLDHERLAALTGERAERPTTAFGQRSVIDRARAHLS